MDSSYLIYDQEGFYVTFYHCGIAYNTTIMMTCERFFYIKLYIHLGVYTYISIWWFLLYDRNLFNTELYYNIHGRMLHFVVSHADPTSKSKLSLSTQEKRILKTLSMELFIYWIFTQNVGGYLPYHIFCRSSSGKARWDQNQVPSEAVPSQFRWTRYVLVSFFIIPWRRIYILSELHHYYPIYFTVRPNMTFTLQNTFGCLPRRVCLVCVFA